MRLRENKKSKFFKKWLFTYIILISISLVFIYSIHTIYDRYMTEDLSKLNRAYIEQVANLFDEEFKSIDLLVYTIALDKRFINLTNMDRQLSVSDRYEIRSIVKNLEIFSRSGRLIEKIDLYASKPMFILSVASAYYGEYMNVYTESAFQMSDTEYQILMEESYSQKVLRLNDWNSVEGGNNPLIYLQTIPIQFQDNPKGVLMITVDERKLESFGRKELLPNGKVLIFNEENQLLYSNDKSFYQKEFLIESITSVGSKEIRIDDTTFIKETIHTDYKNWSYVSLIPKEIYYVRINKIRFIVFVMAILFFLVDFFIACYFTNRMYLPIKKMINSFKKEEKFSDQSEFEYIASVIEKNSIEKEQMKRDLYLQKQSVKNLFFTKLLKGYVKDRDYIEQQLEYFDLFVSNERIQVLLVQFPITEEEQSQIVLSQFIIHNIIEEILSNYFHCQVVEVDGMVACVINYDTTGILVEELEETLTTAIEMMNENFQLDCFIGVSRVHAYVEGISYAYQESLEAVSHARMLGEDKIIYYKDTETLNTQYEFNVEDEYRFINYMRIGDLPKTLEVINEVVNKNMGDQVLKLGYMQCLMYDLMGTIIKSTNDASFNKILNELNPIRRMNGASSIEELKTIIEEVATIACDLGASNLQKNKKFLVEDQINDYIQEHYSDPDLNVSKLGEVFNMTPSYLSKLYKNETGNSIMNALNTVRIEESKKLLEETPLSINEISEKVGYLYSNAFIRFFKKQTGVTPGQYKNMNK